jgi:hypothetical protein
LRIDWDELRLKRRKDAIIIPMRSHLALAKLPSRKRNADQLFPCVPGTEGATHAAEKKRALLRIADQFFIESVREDTFG